MNVQALKQMSVIKTLCAQTLTDPTSVDVSVDIRVMEETVLVNISCGYFIGVDLKSSHFIYNNIQLSSLHQMSMNVQALKQTSVTPTRLVQTQKDPTFVVVRIFSSFSLLLTSSPFLFY